MRLDSRVNAFRADLADVALADRVIAARYAEAAPRVCTLPFAMLHAAATADATAISALLHGERFDVFDIADGWAWGACAHDGYVGFVALAALDEVGAAPTHRIAVPDALVFAAPDIKSRVLATLPCNALLAGRPESAQFIAAAGGYVHARHVAALADTPSQLAVLLAAARGFLGSPYRWGGRTRAGIDCSGLVQAALIAAGVAAPRDSDQLAESATIVPFEARAAGDLLCFPGHIGLLESPDILLHANAFWMRTLSEPLADVLARARQAQPALPVTVRRLPLTPG